jgi:hypothetical protein
VVLKGEEGSYRMGAGAGRVAGDAGTAIRARWCGVRVLLEFAENSHMPKGFNSNPLTGD